MVVYYKLFEGIIILHAPTYHCTVLISIFFFFHLVPVVSGVGRGEAKPGCTRSGGRVRYVSPFPELPAHFRPRTFFSIRSCPMDVLSRQLSGVIRPLN